MSLTFSPARNQNPDHPVLVSSLYWLSYLGSCPGCKSCFRGTALCEKKTVEQTVMSPAPYASLLLTYFTRASMQFCLYKHTERCSSLKRTLCSFLRVSSILRCNSSRFLDVSSSTRVCLAALMTATLRGAGRDSGPPWLARTRNWDDMLVPAENKIHF